MFSWLYKSYGVKRAVGYVFVFTGMYVAPAVPALAPFGEALTQIGLALGAAGVLNAAISK